MRKIVVLVILILNLLDAKIIEYKSIEECGKPSSYISMNYTLDTNNSIDTNIDISIHLSSDISAKIVSLDIKEDEELDIISIDKVYKELYNIDTYDINITTKSSVNGEFYITLYTKTSYNNNFRYKSFIIPIEIGTFKIGDVKSNNNFAIYRGMETISSLK